MVAFSKPARPVLVAAGVAAALLMLTQLRRSKKRILPPPPEESSFCKYEQVQSPKNAQLDCYDSSEATVRLSESGVASEAPTTLVAAFRDAVKRGGEAPALKVERGGKWVTWTWAQYGEEVGLVARALVALKVEQFGSVAILGFNSPEWLCAMMGAAVIGAKAAGICTLCFYPC